MEPVEIKSESPWNPGNNFGCAAMILAAGLALALIIFAASFLPSMFDK